MLVRECYYQSMTLQVPGSGAHEESPKTDQKKKKKMHILKVWQLVQRPTGQNPCECLRFKNDMDVMFRVRVSF